VILIGRIGADPTFTEFELNKQTAGSAGFYSFRLCTTKKRMNPISKEYEEQVTWHTITTQQQQAAKITKG
jgi:single-stranded DNA-binding protein